MAHLNMNLNAIGYILIIIGVYFMYEGSASIAYSIDVYFRTQVGRGIRILFGMIAVLIGTLFLLNKPLRPRYW